MSICVNTENTMKNIDIDFLKNKEQIALNNGFKFDAYGNSERISDDVFSFTRYNFLPTKGTTLDGHYGFYVNYKTFEYRVNQDSYYGSFTWVSPPKETGWKNLGERDKIYIEGIIACQLLAMYFYDYNATDGKGANLFSNGAIATSGDNKHNQSIVTYRDGYKGSKICKPIIELNDYEKLAIKELQH